MCKYYTITHKCISKVKIWRRSFDVPPPPMEPGHPFYDNIVKDPRYKDEPSKEEFPMNEVDI